MRRLSVPRLLLYALAIVLGLALVIAASTSTAAFGTYNFEWDGTADFRELADSKTESQVIIDTESYDAVDPNETVAIILAPSGSYSANDSQRVREFVHSGGTLVVAENFGPHGNTLLEDVGASSRFDGDLLRDERHHYESPNLTVATNIRESRYTTDVDQITMNRGTSVDPHGSRVLVTTSEFAYLDRQETGELNEEEEMDVYPVVTIESLGDGTVIAVSDPSIFINVMLDQPDNAAFARNLFENHERALLDYSHTSTQPPLSAAVLQFRSSVVLQLLVGLLGIVSVWRWSSGSHSRSIRIRLVERIPDRIRRQLPLWALESTRTTELPGPDEDELMSYFDQQFPDWTDARKQRVIAEVLHERSLEDEDE